MSSSKTNKSVAKRVKTRRQAGDEVRRSGHGHFNAKESGKQGHLKKRTKSLKLTPKARQRNLPFA